MGLGHGGKVAGQLIHIPAHPVVVEVREHPVDNQPQNKDNQQQQGCDDRAKLQSDAVNAFHGSLRAPAG
ncbi:hypothetical protein D3C75_868850 [compost metagenome]